TYSMKLIRGFERLRGIVGSHGSQTNLRRADWRFLIPTPPSGSFDHLIVLGGGAELKNQLIESGIARHVSRQITKGRRADAVVILENARVHLRDAVECLVSGGALYYEIDRRGILWPFRSPRRTLQTLLSAGLSCVRPYWIRPGFQNCGAYLPLDAPEAFRWYLKTIFTARTSLQRVREFCLWNLAKLGSRALSCVAARYAVTAIAGQPAQPARSVWGHADLPDGLRRPTLRLFMLTGGQAADLNRRVILLPFTLGSIAPVAVLKFLRLPEDNAGTEDEQR